MKDVAAMIDETIAVEGDYSDDPTDPGGKTRWGVTEVEARRNGYTGDMRNLPQSLARTIYEREYFIRPGFAEVAKAYPAVAAELFDTGVNCGQKVAATMLQRVLNGLNLQGTYYDDVHVDGDIGPATLRALAAYRSKRGAPGERVLLKLLNSLQGERYLALSEGNPKFEKYLYGWIDNRVEI